MARKDREAMEKIRLLRSMSLPPAWMDQSEEGIKRWREMKD